MKKVECAWLEKSRGDFTNSLLPVHPKVTKPDFRFEAVTLFQ
jgi:hypothetical protein